MAIRAGLCHAAKLAFLTGVHQPQDKYMLALYTGNADISRDTPTYTTAGESVGAGYQAGGVLLMGYESGITDGCAWINWRSDPIWHNSTILARGALVYNASKGNVALEVLDFGTDKGSINGEFEINLPASGVTSMITFE